MCQVWGGVDSECSCRAVATVVLQHGTLRCGDILVAGSTWAKVRTMLSDQQKPLKRALPSTPVLTVGWKDVPAAGDLCRQVTLSRSSEIEKCNWPAL